MFTQRAVVEGSSSGDCSSATLLVLAGCNSARKVWPGKRGRGKLGERVEKWALGDSDCRKRTKEERGEDVIKECFIQRACVRMGVWLCASERQRLLRAMGVVPGHAITVQLCWRHRWRFVYGVCICMHVCAHKRRVTQTDTVGVCSHTCIDGHIPSPSSHLSVSISLLSTEAPMTHFIFYPK